MRSIRGGVKNFENSCLRLFTGRQATRLVERPPAAVVDVIDGSCASGCYPTAPSTCRTKTILEDTEHIWTGTTSIRHYDAAIIRHVKS